MAAFLPAAVSSCTRNSLLSVNERLPNGLFGRNIGTTVQCLAKSRRESSDDSDSGETLDWDNALQEMKQQGFRAEPFDTSSEKLTPKVGTGKTERATEDITVKGGEDWVGADTGPRLTKDCREDIWEALWLAQMFTERVSPFLQVALTLGHEAVKLIHVLTEQLKRDKERYLEDVKKHKWVYSTDNPCFHLEEMWAEET